MNCFTHIDELFRQWDTTKSPGCALALVHNGEIIHKTGYGVATLEHHTRIRPTTAFYIASTSKQFSAFSIALLEEAGALSVEDDIRKYIPEMPDYGTSIQIQHMIHHTSGLRDFLELNALSGRHYDELITPEDALAMITRQKELNFKPGEQYLYCNSGYFLLSVIVKRVTGMTLRQFAAEHIFAPLGMQNTHFHDDRTEPVLDRAIGYHYLPDTGYRINVPGLETVGSGGIYSTVEDLALWDKNFYSNKLGKGRMELMERILVPGKLNNGKTLDYAFGLTVQNYRGLKKVGHAGNYGGYSAEFIRFPEKNFTVICLSNNSTLPAPASALKIADIYFAEHLTPAKTVQKDPQAVEVDTNIDGKDGYYFSKNGETILKFIRTENQLALDFRETLFILKPISKILFILENAPFSATVEFADDGEEQTVCVNRQGDNPPETLIKFPMKESTLPEMEAVCGEYQSDELNSNAVVSIQNEQLHLKIGRHHADLLPGLQGKYLVEGNELGRAIIDTITENEKITGLIWNAGRVKNIVFSKK